MNFKVALGLLFIALPLLSCGGGGGSEKPQAPTQTTTPIPSNVNITGMVSYDFIPNFSNHGGLNYNLTEAKPARMINVQAIGNNGSVVATGVTDQNGNYSLLVPENQTVRIRILAQLIELSGSDWDVRVIDNTNSGALYALEGALIDSGTTDSIRNLHASSGWDGSEYSESRSAAPFAILDSIYEGMEYIRVVNPVIDFAPLSINWSEDNRPTDGEAEDGDIGSSKYSSSTNQIYLLGKENIDTDEYDRSVVLHEWAHYFVHNYSRSDSVGGPHSRGDRLDMRIAFNEGLATAMASMILDDPTYRDAIGSDQSHGFKIYIESNNVYHPGWYSEYSIQSIIYDIFDNNSDGVDTLSLGFSPIHSVLINQQKNHQFFMSIFTFITALKDSNLSDVAAINLIVSNQNIESSTMNALGSTEVNSAGNTNSLPIYTELHLGGSAINLCMNDLFGAENKLANRRYLHFSIPSSGNYRIQATRQPLGSFAGDPDFFIYQNGQFINFGASSVEDNEFLTATYNPGVYAMSLREFTITDDISPRDNEYCYDLSLEVL